MKIHEIRKTQLLEANHEVDEGILDLFRKQDPNVHTPSRQQKKASKKREKDVTKLINRAFELWQDHLDQVKATLPDEARGEIPPERVKRDLETFIQNNLLGGRKISTMDNAQDIEAYVNKLSNVPEVTPPADSTQEPVAAPTSTAVGPSTSTEQPSTDRMSQRSAATVPADDWRSMTADKFSPDEIKWTQMSRSDRVKILNSELMQDYAVLTKSPLVLGDETGNLYRQGKNGWERSEGVESAWRKMQAPEKDASLDRFVNKIKSSDDLASTSPANIKKPEPPITVSRSGIERVNANPLILRRGRTEYVIGDEGEWVKQGQKKAENESMQALLTQAAEEFENSDTNYADQMAAYRQATGQESPTPQPEQPRQKTTGPEQLLPGQTRQVPSPEQAAAERQAAVQTQAQQQAEIAAAAARAEQERLAADAADRAQGVEPPSRGLIRKPGSGRGMQAQFEPIKESLRTKIANGELTLQEARGIYQQLKQQLLREADEKLTLAKQKELFAKLVRTAVLSRPITGTQSDKKAQQKTQATDTEVKSTGNQQADELLQSAGFRIK